MTEAKGEARELPKGWVSCELQSLCELITKGSTPTTYGHQYQEKGITFVRTENINHNGFIFNIKHFIDEEANDFLKRSRLKAGDLLFSIAGTIGRVGIVREKDFPANTNQALSILRLIKNGISVQYLFYFLKSPLIQKSTLKRIAGVGRANLSLTDVGEFNVLLAPLFEQKRIVEKIEELFSDLDQGIESLKTAQKQLKVYRQVVLKWAFEGKLTEKWRSQIQQEKLDLQTGEELLAQIKAERENRYQQQLAEWEEAVREWEAIGKSGKKPTKPQKLKELLPFTKDELSELPQLPDSWSWVKFGELVSSIRGGTTAVPIDTPTDYPILRSSSVRTGSIDYSDVRFVVPEQASDIKDFVIVNDLIFTRLNGTVDYVGNCSRVTEYHPNNLIYPDRLYCAKLLLISMAKYIERVFESPIARRIIEKKAKSTAGHKRISIPNILNMPLPLLNLAEIDVIVLDLEAKLSVVEKFEDTIIENLQKAEALRQSILKQAFEGKLVPQDPNDEPAEKLL